MRLFHLIRDDDVSGVSGIGRVAEVVELENGKVVVGWLRGAKTVAVFDSLDDVIAVHGHEGSTWLELERDSDLEQTPPARGTYRAARALGHR